MLGHDDNRKKMHFKKWKNLCLEKYKGGTEFRELISFNQALLAKLAWWIFTQENFLVFKILKNKYFQHTSFLKATCSSTSSWIEKNITWGRDLLQKEIR